MSEAFEDVLNYALENGFQIQPNVSKWCEIIDVNEIKNIIQKIINKKTDKNDIVITENDFNEWINKTTNTKYNILLDPTSRITSGEGINGYYSLFKDRFVKLKKIIMQRPEFKKINTISDVLSEKSNNIMYVCGLLLKRDTEKKFIKLIIDDLTNSIEVLVFDEKIKNIAGMLLLDQLAIFKIQVNDSRNIICKEIILPDIPERKPNRSKNDTYVVFISDLHIGSKYFMEKEFNEFISWLSSEDYIATKIAFIIIVGDLVDGIGIYPGQNDELNLDTIDKQLHKTAYILSKIPKRIKIFVIPGNHDPGRRALPQPAIPGKFKFFNNNENISLIGNPSLISLNDVKVLIYHGQSIDDVVKTTPGIHYDKPTTVMKLLLRSRHLSPIYGNRTPIAPEYNDMLVIDNIPDIFVTGHVHILDYNSYRGTLLINSGTWQKQTPFQSSVGITPTPGTALIVNLKTFKVYQNNFS
ncbi:MAG: DNA-directed DNA polymerase II small subunit [Nitrosopumilaceae archaeon]|nr:DNA-directed DNA polymerase II small subunit [Nitrosopumilaceae archaeon]